MTEPEQIKELLDAYEGTIEALTILSVRMSEQVSKHITQIVILQDRVDALTNEVNNLKETTIQFSKQ